MLECFRLAHFRFCLLPKEPLFLPSHNKGNTLRGAFGSVFKRLRDRIYALAYFYCGETLPIDHKGLGERAEEVVCTDADFRWEERSRTSRKRNLSHEMSGFVGKGTYEGSLEEFWPLLILGQHLHVGKYAVWRNGWYEIVSEENKVQDV